MFTARPSPPRKSRSIQIRLRQLDGAASIGRRAYATRLIRERYEIDAGRLTSGSARNYVVDHDSAGPTGCGGRGGYCRRKARSGVERHHAAAPAATCGSAIVLDAEEQQV